MKEKDIKIGMRVKVVKDGFKAFKGMLGHIMESEDKYYYFECDTYIDGHDADGYGMTGCCWYLETFGCDHKKGFTDLDSCLCALEPIINWIKL